MDIDTVFEATSVSKTVFAYAVMKLCEKDQDTKAMARAKSGIFT